MAQSIKLLLTGKPRSGKSTLLEKCIALSPQKQGFLSREILKDEQRVGFELIASDGQSVVMAHVDSPSQLHVSRYGVNIDNITNFLRALPAIQSNSLLYLDEIGQMQLLTPAFPTIAMKYLDADNHFIGTITSVFRDETIDNILSRDDITLLNLTEENREDAHRAAQAIITNLPAFDQLSPEIRQHVVAMAQRYAATAQLTQLRKLFSNAILYVNEGLVDVVDAHTYHVHGKTRDHIVKKHVNILTCDCDLFLGKGTFSGLAGECSHIQAITLMSASR